MARTMDEFLEERFAEVEGFPNYLVSSYGRIISTRTNQDIVPAYHRGYYVVNLSTYGISKTFLLHRLVAKAFLPNYEEDKQVLHENGNKHDNTVYNLVVSHRRRGGLKRE